MAQAPAAQIEYTIYTFDMPVPNQKGENAWQKHSSGADMSKAMRDAEQLLATQKYRKIEVKKKFFDAKKNRVVDMTLKIFETTPQKDYTLLIACLTAILGGLAAFAAAFFLTK